MTDPTTLLRALLTRGLVLHLEGAAGGGYAPRPLPLSAWTLTPGPELARAKATVTFHFAGPAGTVTGWRLDADGETVACDTLRNDAGRPRTCVVRVAGSSITVHPSLIIQVDP